MIPQHDDFDESTLTQGPGDRPPEADRSPRSYLLVFEGTGSSIFYLPPTGEVVIGRGEGVQLHLQSAATSRRHAVLMGTTDGGVCISDLGSHNGTLVNGERVEGQRRLAGGDVITVSYATLVFHQAPQRQAAQRVLELDAFRQRLEDEVERSLRYARPVALLTVNVEPVIPQAIVLSALRGQLRRIDVAAFATPSQLLVLLPEHDGETAAQAGARVLRALLPRAAATRMGIACCPVDGCDISSLLAGGRAAAIAAAPRQALAAGQAACTVDLGDHVVVVADPAMVQLFELLRRLAATELPVLVCGETGVGKENAALALHRFSGRKGGPLVPINCAALPEGLIESELFGHRDGAFTGAISARVGLIERAHGGTVFLDEVGELSASAQAKLLRVLETKRVTRLGETDERVADVRLVAATNRDLRAEVSAGRFRQDLYFRIGATTVLIPPLRDRKRDLPVLAQRFLAAACKEAGREPMTIAPATLQVLASYDWPGNVRELKNAMEYAGAMLRDSALEPWMLPESIQPAPVPAGEGDTELVPLLPEAAPAGPRFRPIADEVRELERRRMAEALAAAGGVQKRAAELIDMPLRTFIVKLAQYGLEGHARKRRRD